MTRASDSILRLSVTPGSSFFPRRMPHSSSGGWMSTPRCPSNQYSAVPPKPPVSANSRQIGMAGVSGLSATCSTRIPCGQNGQGAAVLCLRHSAAQRSSPHRRRPTSCAGCDGSWTTRFTIALRVTCHLRLLGIEPPAFCDRSRWWLQLLPVGPDGQERRGPGEVSVGREDRHRVALGHNAEQDVRVLRAAQF